MGTQKFDQAGKSGDRFFGVKNVGLVIEKILGRRPGKGQNNCVVAGKMKKLGPLGRGPVKITVCPVDVDKNVFIERSFKDFVYFLKVTVKLGRNRLRYSIEFVRPYLPAEFVGQQQILRTF